MNTEATFVLRSSNQAVKAKKILSSLNIASRVVKPSATGTSRESDGGCVYGIAVNKTQLIYATEILEKNGIEIKEILHV